MRAKRKRPPLAAPEAEALVKRLGLENAAWRVAAEMLTDIERMRRERKRKAGG